MNSWFRSAIFRLCMVVVALIISVQAHVRADDQTLNIMVAPNARPALDAIAARFQDQSSPDRRLSIRLSMAPTGIATTQVLRGAPFDLFFSADKEAIDWLLKKGRVQAKDRAPYAYGRLVIAARTPDDAKRILRQQPLKLGRGQKVAIANPHVAPYGRAAYEMLDSLNLRRALSDHIIYGNGAAQTLVYFTEGRAALAILPASLVPSGKIDGQTVSKVPARLHKPIRQDMAIIASTANRAAAEAFFAFIQSDTARTILTEFGYEVPRP